LHVNLTVLLGNIVRFIACEKNGQVKTILMKKHFTR